MSQQTLTEETNQNARAIQIAVNIEEKGLLDITLMDLQGNLIHNESNFVDVGEFNHDLPLKRPLSSKCVLRVALNGKSLIKKMI